MIEMSDVSLTDAETLILTPSLRSGETTRRPSGIDSTKWEIRHFTLAINNYLLFSLQTIFILPIPPPDFFYQKISSPKIRQKIVPLLKKNLKIICAVYTFWSGNLLYFLKIWLPSVLSTKLVLVGTLEAMSTLQPCHLCLLQAKKSTSASGTRRNSSCQWRLTLLYRWTPPIR